MRVFFVTHSFGGGGGSEQTVAEFLTELSSRGHEVFVFAPDSVPTDEHECGIYGSYKTPVAGHHALHKFEYLLFYRKAVKLAEKFGAQIVHANDSSQPGVIAHKIKERLGIPHVLALIGVNENKSVHGRVCRAFEQVFLPRLNYDVLVSVYRDTLDRFAIPWGVNPERATVIPGIIDVNLFSDRVDGSKINEKYGDHLITTAKSLVGYNVDRISVIVKAMKYVAEAHPEYKFVIFGAGAGEAKLKKLIGSLGLEKNVVLGGFVAHRDVPAVYNAGHISPFVSDYGPLNVRGLMESMACGSPLVVQDHAELKELLQEGAVFVKNEPRSFADGIIRMIEDENLRKGCGEKARRAAVENFSPGAVVDKYLEVYERLVKE